MHYQRSVFFCKDPSGYLEWRFKADSTRLNQNARAIRSPMKKLDFTVVGAPRSGTSLLSSLIDRHPNVRIAHDTGLYYYLKFALIEILYLKQAKKDLTFLQGYNSLPLNSLADQQLVDEFLKKKPRIILSLQPSNQFRRIFDQYLFRLWSFWTHDFNVPDPTKDRNKAGIFLECIDISKLLDTSSMKELILEYQNANRINQSGAARAV